MEQADNNTNCPVDQQQTNADVAERLKRLELQEMKDTNQVWLAWAAMISMSVVTGLLFCPFIPDARILAVKDILDLYYVAQASVIGMYMGAKAFMNRRQ